MDRIIGGYKQNRRYLIAGRPSLGKTSLLVQGAMQSCARGVRTRIVSLEMTSGELLQRMWAVIAEVPYERVVEPTSLSQEEWERIKEAERTVQGWLRAFLLERGMAFAKSPAKLRVAMPDILENAEAELTPRMRNLVARLWEEWSMVDQRIEELNHEIEQIASSDGACQRLRKIPGIGPLIATAIVATIGNGAAFRKGREFAASVGLVPRQHSTGGKVRLLAISKGGNPYC